VVSWNGAQSHWNISFSRSPNDWEEDNVCNFIATLAKINVLRKGIDNIVWPHVPKSSFTIKSFCQKLYDGGNCFDFLVKGHWKSKAATKVCFFVWQLLK